MTSNKLRNAIGLALKAGYLRTGYATCEKQIMSNDVKLILLDSKAAKNTVQKITGLSRKYKVELTIIDENIIENATGRANAKIATVSNDGFRDMITKLIK